MKVFISFPIKSKPYGGANQFLKALAKELELTGHLTQNPATASLILVNANPSNLFFGFQQALRLKQKFPKAKAVIRIDGPISLIRNTNNTIDKLILKLSNLLADGIIFQSQWSAKHNNLIQTVTAPNQTVIYNSPDNHIFYPQTTPKPSVPIRLIATSWSSNQNKGFSFYRYIDENLDFKKYHMTFVGNAPQTFKNIRCLSPVSSHQLAHLLRQSDIYITASRNDPCSNALIEALACGLPVVAMNSGGHPELVQNNGELFQNATELIQKLETIISNYSRYTNRLPRFSISQTATEYVQFFSQVSDTRSTPISIWKTYRYWTIWGKYYFTTMVSGIISRIFPKI